MRPVLFKNINGQDIYLTLKVENDRLDLMACDRSGNKLYNGYILYLNIPSGKIRRHYSLNTNIGISLNKYNMIQFCVGDKSESSEI